MKYLGMTAGLYLLCVGAFGTEYALEVRNGAVVRENVVVSHTVTREWAASAATHTLVEVTAEGQTTPVPCGVDVSGDRPVLFWELSGKTAAGAVRRFAWVPTTRAAAASGDLLVTEKSGFIVVSNGFFCLKHPLRGGGGFPCDITYVHSGNADPQLFFFDRIVRRKGENKGN